MSNTIKLRHRLTGEIVKRTPQEIVDEVNNPEWHCEEWRDYTADEWREALGYYDDYEVLDDVLKIGAYVLWRDPDDESCKRKFSITDIDGEIFHLARFNQWGELEEEVEAMAHEIELA